MKKTINIAERLPRWYGTGIMIVYSLLFAEFSSTINHLFPIDLMNDLLSIFFQISYGLTIVSGMIVWIVMTFLFHLTALLLNGRSSFGRFLFTSAYPYIIPAIMILAGILIVDNIPPISTMEEANVLMNNQSLTLAMNLINYSFIPYYILIAVIIHYLYEVKYLFAALSVMIPVVSVWLITELFKILL
ncbi:MAG: hypothetical protein LBP56_09310 [Odoribacteraceae bacterium]|jgi:hypothetical protein|nr:hypothetical protein [Odoribacteraceae bacterium]